MKEILFIQCEGQNLKINKGVWDSPKEPPQSVLTIAFIESNVITGMYKG